jgi:hypothetical protein
MKIETKYNVGDTVFVMSNNKIRSGKIVKPHFDNDYSGKKEFNLEKMLGWELDIKEFILSMHESNVRRLETEIFLTKEELLADLGK